MDSILNSVKKALGITEEYTHFDDTLILHINSVFMILKQMGVGPSNGFSINDSSTIWNEYIAGKDISSVRSFMCMKVKMMFDPPSSSIVADATNKLISELEWRLNVASDN